jgi:hypothetical protein
VITVAFLIVYPNVFSFRKLPKKFTNSLNYIINPYIRIILEIAHNFGFVLALIPGKVSLNRNIKLP